MTPAASRTGSLAKLPGEKTDASSSREVSLQSPALGR